MRQMHLNLITSGKPVQEGGFGVQVEAVRLKAAQGMSCGAAWRIGTAPWGGGFDIQ